MLIAVNVLGQRSGREGALSPVLAAAGWGGFSRSTASCAGRTRHRQLNGASVTPSATSRWRTAVAICTAPGESP